MRPPLLSSSLYIPAVAVNTVSRLRKVVLIDDNETTNFLNHRLITKLGITEEVAVFSDAAEGYRYLWGHQGKPGTLTTEPELVFVDLRMPGMDGIEFLELYKQLEPAVRQSTRLVVLTTSMLPSDRARVAAYPDVEYLVKPLSREKVERLLTEHFPHVQAVAPPSVAS